MAAIDGISTAVNSSSATSYQVKSAPQVETVEAVTEGASGTADPKLASQIKTVNESTSGEEGQGSAGQQQEPTHDQIKKAVEDLNKKMKDTACEFGIHDETNRVTIKIVDKETKSTIKEFPAEETLDMIAKAWELAGLMVDKRL